MENTMENEKKKCEMALEYMLGLIIRNMMDNGFFLIFLYLN